MPHSVTECICLPSGPLHAASSPSEFIRFLNTIEAGVPAGRIIHVALDNYAADKHPKVHA